MDEPNPAIDAISVTIVEGIKAVMLFGFIACIGLLLIGFGVTTL